MAIETHGANHSFIPYSLGNLSHADLAETGAQFNRLHSLIDQFLTDLNCLLSTCLAAQPRPHHLETVESLLRPRCQHCHNPLVN